VYYQRGRGECTSLLSRFCRKANKPFISALSMDIDCRKYKNLPRVFDKDFRLTPRVIYGLLRNFWMDRRSLAGLHRATAVLCQSGWQQRELKSNLKIESKIFKNIHFVPSKLETVKSEPPIVLWLANLKEWKQPEIFIALAESLKDLNCQFILAGRIVDARYKSSVEEAMSRIKNFKYIENVSFKKSNDLIARACLFVNTSLCNEGFPNTFIQAWLREVPTITLNFDPDGTIKKHSFGRHSVTFDNLVLDVVELVNDSAKRNKIGKLARMYAEREFSLQANFATLHNLAIDLVKSKKT